MKIENVSLPYPVLGINDDICPTLEETQCADPIICRSEDENTIHLSVTLKLENQDILDYIQNGFAEYSVEVSCNSTMFRKCITSSTPEFNFPIEKKLLNGKLEFESFVIVKKDIFNYSNKGLNEDYTGHIINLHKGDLLVAYKKCSIPLNIDLHNVREMKSIMKIQKSTNENEKSVSYELDSQKILIILPEEMMIEYNKKPSNIPDNEERKIVLKASLFLQALTYALLNYNKYKETDYLWVNALNYRMNEPDIKDFCSNIFTNEEPEFNSQNIGEIFQLAHMMLNQPYLPMLKHISTNENSLGNIIND